MQQFDRPIDLGRVARRTDVVRREALAARALPRILVLGIKNVLRNLDQRDALRRSQRLAEGHAHVELDGAEISHTLGVLGDASQHVGSIGFLEGALVVLGVGMLTRDADHGAVGHRGQRQSGHRVGQAAAGRDHTDPGLAGHASKAVGRVGGRLLVAHVDQLDLMAAQLRENREQVTTVDRETIARLIFLDDTRDQFAAVHFGHQRSSFD